MIDLIAWLTKVPGHRVVPLFDCDEAFLVKTTVSGAAERERQLLCRSAKMENAVIELVEEGLKSDDWEGLFYIMGKRPFPQFLPMYVGKAERKGTKNSLSTNLKDLRTKKSFFARWGNDTARHIGALSQVLFQFQADCPPKRKYQRWAHALFRSLNPPTLKEPVFLYVASWMPGQAGPSGLRCSLPAVEKEVIALGSAEFGETLLNTDGV
jgi:hypothetical protein